jgi:hypothetical protein
MENRKAGKDQSGSAILENLPLDPALAIPLLRDLASGPGKNPGGVIKKRLDRRYARLCVIQEELNRLNDRQPEAGTSFEDFVFSRTDFSRYKIIPPENFELYTLGLEDYDENFFTRNLRLSRKETVAAIAGAYKKTGAGFCLVRPGPLILSIMRTLETSPDMVPLITEGEILEELRGIYEYLKAGPFPAGSAGGFFRFLVQTMDQVTVTHQDGRETKLVAGPGGSLSGIFRPRDKPWTLTLIPGEAKDGNTGGGLAGTARLAPGFFIFTQFYMPSIFGSH